MYLLLVLSCLSAVADPEECRYEVVAAPYEPQATLRACEALAREVQAQADRLNRVRDPRRGYVRAWCAPAREYRP